MPTEAKRIMRYAVLFVGLFWGFAAASDAQSFSSAQTFASSPSPSAGVQYVAPTCAGGVPCILLNDGLSAGSAKWDADAGKAINDAYAALPPGGGIIYLLSLPGCISFSTPINLTTQGKYVAIIGDGMNTTCLNYTPSTGAALTLATGAASLGQDDLEKFSLRTATEGSVANGLVVGAQGVAAPYTKLDGVSISGFRDDLVDNSYGLVLTDTTLAACSSAADSVAFQTGNTGANYGDDARIHASQFEGCATLLAVGNENPVWADELVLANASSVWVNVPNGGLFCDRCHWFNQSGTANWFSTAANLIITNSQFEDSTTTGTSTSYATETAGFTVIANSVLYSGGHSVTEFVSVTGGNIFLSNFANTTPQQIPKLTDGRYGDAYAQAVIQGSGGISAGSCTTSSGQCSHTFTQPYNIAPICTVAASSAVQTVSPPTAASPPTIVASPTAVAVTATGAADGTILNWICYLAAN